jgi:hypothetical protein
MIVVRLQAPRLSDALENFQLNCFDRSHEVCSDHDAEEAVAQGRDDDCCRWKILDRSAPKALCRCSRSCYISPFPIVQIYGLHGCISNAHCPIISIVIPNLTERGSTASPYISPGYTATPHRHQSSESAGHHWWALVFRARQDGGSTSHMVFTWMVEKKRGPWRLLALYAHIV